MAIVDGPLLVQSIMLSAYVGRAPAGSVKADVPLAPPNMEPARRTMLPILR